MILDLLSPPQSLWFRLKAWQYWPCSFPAGFGKFGGAHWYPPKRLKDKDETFQTRFKTCLKLSMINFTLQISVPTQVYHAIMTESKHGQQSCFLQIDYLQSKWSQKKFLETFEKS